MTTWLSELHELPDLDTFTLFAKEQIEKTLLSLFPEERQEPLFEAARYALLAPAKRIRPLLLLSTVQALGSTLAIALYPALAIEMIHSFSLIHDDLPAMDNDDLRRGKPTLHKVYKEGHALLTGDFLLNYAFETLGKSPGLSSSQKIELIQILSTQTGEKGMIGGQAIDLAWSDHNYIPTIEELDNLHLKKTAALFSAPLVMGGVIAEASQKTKDLLFAIGQSFGLAFQIIDDIEDGDGVAALLGKEEALIHAKKAVATMEACLEQLDPPLPLVHALLKQHVKI